MDGSSAADLVVVSFVFIVEGGLPICIDVVQQTEVGKVEIGPSEAVLYMN